jgi:glucose/arabinose dehydrogenase
MRMNKAFLLILIALPCIGWPPTTRGFQRKQKLSDVGRDIKLTPRNIRLSGGRSFDLNVPEGLSISVAAEGLKRVRFMALSPDDRVFVTDMYNLSDNKKGTVYILENFDPVSRSFQRVAPYLKNLRNPNSIAFYRDREGVDWIYVAMTDHLVRYRYLAGESSPSSKPEILATFPDYGLSYKYGGWHLTRTVSVGENGKIYVSVGSSCNACIEKEDVRASVLEMDPDGRNLKSFAVGLRNAVGLRWIENRLFATNMGADHLGDHKPADTMYELTPGTNYGWPFCYQSGYKVFSDPGFTSTAKRPNCNKVPVALAAFDSHSSPLGFEYFSQPFAGESAPFFLVALHGSTKKTLNHGYRVVLVRRDGPKDAAPEDFITGFYSSGQVHGRPADIMKFGNDGFLLTDDYAGVVYYVYQSN